MPTIPVNLIRLDMEEVSTHTKDWYKLFFCRELPFTCGYLVIVDSVIVSWLAKGISHPRSDRERRA